uniref:myogenesis-regulating glycosidase-like n=1 Tax=Styela clava TaxID=7725 RepID=UPI001939F49F|nr:myogenesis-regulating glycosidase-like [Styela clava]
MKLSKRTISFLVAVVSLVIVCSVAVLCVILLPVEEEHSPDLSGRDFSFRVTTSGEIIWTDTKTGSKKLGIQSNIRGQSDCKDSVCHHGIHYLEDKSPGEVECYEVFSSKDTTEENLEVQDCVFFEEAEDNEKVYWYGGSELYLQRWPINEVNKRAFEVYLSTDLPWRHGNVLERYWLSSNGAAIFVYSNVPLSVSQTANETICFRAAYNNTYYFGLDYSPSSTNDTFSNTKTELRYAVCLSNDATATHEAMLESRTNNSSGFIDRPTGLPDTRMFQDPIWSTWARYKEDINQSIVENFAEEIIGYNFTNAQLEIDDGYETYYGDFTFDETKFPDAVKMIKYLHDKGFRVTTWVTPFINQRSNNFIPGRTRGYFIKSSETDNSPDLVVWWNGIGAVIDFSNEDATTWYEKLLQDVKKDYGIDSFKFDAGETNYVPRKGHTKKKIHNPGDYTTYYSMSAFNQGGNMMEMRSAWKTQSFPFYMRMMDKGSRWGGFKGIRTVIPTALTFGIIGYPYVLPDMIGGNAYGNLKPDKELFIRWLELTAFLPVMQFSITPWDYDLEVTALAKFYVDLHRTVIYDEIMRVSQKYVDGTSNFMPVSPIWYCAALDETEAFASSDQFLVGERYLVAPIVNEGAIKRDLYLPRGKNKEPILWRDMLHPEEDLFREGGQWVKDYPVELHEISWWENSKFAEK